MRFQAHRGVSTEYPENTLPAFQAALEQGYHVIELDPAFTADLQCVTFHDRAVNRTCRTRDGKELTETKNLCDLTYEEVQALDAGIFMGEEFKGTTVPLLSQVLDLAKRGGMLIKLDSKFERKFDLEQQEIFFDIVRRSGARVAFTSERSETVRLVAERFPDAEIHYDGFADEERVLEIKGLLKNNPFTVWMPLPSPLTSWVKVPLATPERCEMVKRHGDLGLWILETREQLEEANRLGADIIETTGAIKPEDRA